MRRIATLALVLTLAPGPLAAAEPFRFEAVKTLDEMADYLRRETPAGAQREAVRARFVEAGATHIVHPRKPEVEKYIYDINLCSYYVWRWNISADYDDAGLLKQIYVNGQPALGKAKPPGLPTRGPFFQLSRPRPEAHKGEHTLMAVVADPDRDTKTTDDMLILTGVGPTRADPLDMGRALNFPGELWRSIFDADPARVIADYPGDCAAVDAAIARKLGAQAPATQAPASPAPATPGPTAFDEATLRRWIGGNLQTEGWTLIGVSSDAVILGAPQGVSVLDDGTLKSDVRHEYFAPVDFGPLRSISNRQTWKVDCRGRRYQVTSITIFAGRNLAGASEGRAFGDAAEWRTVGKDSPEAVTLDRICDAPRTGQRMK